MKHRKIVSPKNLPMRCPLIGALCTALAIDRWHLTSLWSLWTIFYTTVFTIWIVDTWHSTAVDLFESEGDS